MQIGTAIKQLRKQSKLTQGKLADMAGITQAYLSKVENGSKSPHEPTLKSIANSLQVSLAVIYVMAITEEDIKSNDRADKNVLFALESGKALILQAL